MIIVICQTSTNDYCLIFKLCPSLSSRKLMWFLKIIIFTLKVSFRQLHNTIPYCTTIFARSFFLGSYLKLDSISNIIALFVFGLNIEKNISQY